jgi:hypothetical protein
MSPSLVTNLVFVQIFKRKESKYVSYYNNLVRFLIELQSKVPPEPYRRLKELTITWLADVANEYFVEYERMAIELETPSEGARAIRLSLQSSPEAASACIAELSRLKQMIHLRQIDPFSKPQNL